jgi:hypothetical protein
LGEIVNLRLARKRKVRESAGRGAAERRVRFGQPKTETQAEAKRRELAARTLDGHRRDGADEP